MKDKRKKSSKRHGIRQKEGDSMDSKGAVFTKKGFNLFTQKKRLGEETYERKGKQGETRGYRKNINFSE